MASILKVDELRGIVSAGDITVTSEGGAATQSLQQGLAKTWVSINSASPAIRGSLNVSSLTDDGTATGVMKITTTNAFDSTDNMSVSSGAGNATNGSGYYKSAGWINNTNNYFIRAIWDTAGYDVQYVFGQVHGDLA